MVCDVHIRQGGFQPDRQLVHVVVRPEVHVEQPRLVIEHVVVNGSHFDPVLTQRLDDGFHFLGDQDEVARDSDFVTVGWKLMAFADPMASGTSIPPSVIRSARGMLNW